MRWVASHPRNLRPGAALLNVLAIVWIPDAFFGSHIGVIGAVIMFLGCARIHLEMTT